ncbi:MAG: glycoside hydrolase [Acidobacteriota bacterium]|nr:glycoside hydrolase [Acidobacteriota bacterium]MDH3786079.1 glycoside hydrolase [Acidobacteriota bacterium]
MMAPILRVSLFTTLFLVTLSGCGGADRPATLSLVDHPAPPGATFPDLATQPDGTVVLSWLTPPTDDTPGRVQIARRLKSGWQPTTTVAEHARLFVNWADFPRLGIDRTGEILVSYSRDETRAKFGQRIQVVRGNADGTTWQSPLSLHESQPPAEYGFVSMSPAEGLQHIAWLDGRDTVQGGTGKMQLRVLNWPTNDEASDGQLLDPDVCSCCQTAMTTTDDGMLLAYRDHTPAEIRDIAVIRQTETGWTSPAVVHDDRWKIAGCPVNGPALDSSAQRVALAWFTQADDQPRVKLAISEDGGRSFAEPIVLPDEDPVGRVSVRILSDGRVVVVWLRRGASNGEIVLGGIDPDGDPMEVQVLGEASPQRRSGFPRSTRVNDALWVAWTIGGRDALKVVEVRF